MALEGLPVLKNSRRRPWIFFALIAGLILIGFIIARWRMRRSQRAVREKGRGLWPDISQIQGLSEAEAEARRLPGLDIAEKSRISPSTRDIWRRNLFSIFNLNLIGLAVALLLLGQPLEALTSAAGALFSIAMGVRQQLMAKKQLDRVAAATRPEAVVIREGNVRTIDPIQVVRGDVLLVGPGDQVFADGQVISEGRIVLDESMLTGEADRITKGASDAMYAGSICVAGRGAYEVETVGGERFVETLTAKDDGTRGDMTPLQTIMERILRILLVVVTVFVVGLLASYYVAGSDAISNVYKDAISMAFGIAPSGLFFMFIITYAVATADITKIGAVIHRTSAVEALANVTVICIGKTSGLTGIGVQLDSLDLPNLDERMTQRRVRRALGDFAHSTPTSGTVNRIIAEEFAGQSRKVVQEAPFFSAYGWNAVVFDEPDLRGVFVLGDPEALKPHLIKDVAGIRSLTDAKDETSVPQALSGFVGRLSGVFRREDQDPDAHEEENAEHDKDPQSANGPQVAAPSSSQSAPAQPKTEDASVENEGQPSRFRGLLQRAQAVLSRSDAEPEGQATEEAEDERERELYRLLFAYLPQIKPLRGADGSPQLPSKLVPLCYLRLVEQVREEAIGAIQTFAEEGVDIKVLSSDPPEAVAKTAAQVGLGQAVSSGLGVVSGRDLAALEATQFAKAVAENAVFGDLTPEQTGQVVQTLREKGETVAMVGHGVIHVPALRNANLRITIQSGSQAALSIADIVLLNDSLSVLSEVLNTGQRIVNGMLDMLKLNLTQVIYLALLLTAGAFIGFPYAPQHGSFISLFTLSLPSTGLSLWAATGALPAATMRTRLLHFSLPAAVTMTATALGVHLLFRTSTGDVAYAQLATAYTIVACGLLLVVFVQPPTRAWVGGDVFSGDTRPARLVAGLSILFIIIGPMRLAQRFLHTEALRQVSDYVVIGLIAVGWGVIQRFLWRSRLLARFSGMDLDEGD